MNKQLWTKVGIGALYVLLAIVLVGVSVAFVRSLQARGYIPFFKPAEMPVAEGYEEDEPPVSEEHEGAEALVPDIWFHDWHKLAVDRESLSGLDILGMWESEPYMIVIVYISPDLLDGESSPAALVEFVAQSVMYWSEGRINNVLVWVVVPKSDDCIAIWLECGYRIVVDGSIELWRVAERSDECLDPSLVVWPGVGK